MSGLTENRADIGSIMADELPPPVRLALAYAPSIRRADWMAALVLDARLARIVKHAREPVLAQIRLAWWRERLGGGDHTGGDPLLKHLAGWGGVTKELVTLVDGWEVLLAEPPLDKGASEAFAVGRMALVRILSVLFGCETAFTEAVARRWALADLCTLHSDAAYACMAYDNLNHSQLPSGRMPRAMRPLAVLERLTTGTVQGRSSGIVLISAMRAGLIGC